MTVIEIVHRLATAPIPSRARVRVTRARSVARAVRHVYDPTTGRLLGMPKGGRTRLAFDGAWALLALQHGLYFSAGTSR